MLQLRNIKKDYKVGDSTVAALKGVSLSFRRNEFVSILGASGCGKTTLLNIIGGLDHYTSGDLIIEGISTKDYKDGDWDTYRNHRIGFVFQTYNLIPHQTVLSNVELALTLSGVSPKERKARATEALRCVGLESELNKKPNQLSGGQMQRVAIARALVNNPEILLADEPTGALDTNTSVQIMDLIKEIAGERLVIMVTHNPELAYKYSSRIVELKDGLVVSDSAPYSREEEEEEVARHKAAVDEQTAVEPGKKDDKAASRAAVYKKKHSSMSLLTAFALSGKNLLTKKTRTLITSIAGSIGIISVCLVLALSSGFNSYIRQTEEDMLSYYPVEVSETSVDLTSAMSSFMSGSTSNIDLDEIDNKVYVNSFLSQLAQGMTTQNDLTEDNVANIDGQEMNYLEYLEAMPEELYNAIMYSYGVSMSGNLFTDVEIGSETTGIEPRDAHLSLDALREYYTYILTTAADEYSNLTQFVQFFTEVVNVMPGTSGDFSDEDFGSYVKSQYEIIAGDFPQSSDEIVLVVGEQNDVIDLTLVQLGFLDETRFLDLFISAEDGVDDSEPDSIPFDEIIGREYTLYYNDALYKQSDGEYEYQYTGYNIAEPGENAGLVESAQDGDYITLKISGILRLQEGLTYGCLTSGLNFTEQLVLEYIEKNMQSDIVNSINSLGNANEMSAMAGEQTIANWVENLLSGGLVPQRVTAKYSSQSGFTSSDLEEIVRELGGNNRPSTVSLYARDFDTKEDLLAYLDGWNDAVSAARQDYELNGANSVYADENGEYAGPTEINYSDTVGTLMGMVNTILDAITYVLIAFTAISLVVSTVMIGVITYVSVVERTKEIGILRSIGARKRDIRHVFNAETFIIGLFAGLIGVIVAYLLQLLINVILTPLTGISGLAALPIWQAAIMLCVSIVLTLISGLIPASSAANKDPVIALRTE